MNRRILLLAFFIASLNQLSAQLFQQNFQIPGNYFHAVFTDQLSDSTKDLVVMGSLFDDVLLKPKIQVLRIDEVTGDFVGQATYYDPNNIVQNPRVFDFVQYEENSVQMLAITGSVSVSGQNYAFIVKINVNGTYMGGAYYSNIVPGATQSQGLHIIHSQQGFVIGGFTNMDYDHGSNDPKSGFVLKTDLNLNPIWTKEILTNYANATADYDMANHILETDDGYFITGSVTSAPSSTLQGVLCLKLDFNGNFVWSNSYVYGNSRDVGVDAYYESSNDEIYLLTNYSSRHYFGVTVLNDNTGTIDASKSWTAYDWNNLNRYAFSINESATSNSNLVISGYIRDGQVLDQDSVLVSSQSIPFVYEFEKSTGDQVGLVYYYHVPYVHPVFNDYFDFWDAQMPLIYYPDMSVKFNNDNYYFHVAYRTDSSNSFTNAELIKTDAGHLNECYRSPINLDYDPIAVTPTSTDTNNLNPVKNSFDLIQDNLNYVLNITCGINEPCSCDSLPADVAAGFTYTSTGYTFNFTPIALDPECDSVEWNFGDGNYAYSQGNQTVTHIYNLSEIFDVCIKVTRYTDDGFVCTDSICERIDLTTVGIYNDEESGINIWPNPVKSVLYVSFKGKQSHTGTYRVINILGDIVIEGKLENAERSVINTDDLARGMYIIQIRLSEEILTRKFLK